MFLQQAITSYTLNTTTTFDVTKNETIENVEVLSKGLAYSGGTNYLGKAFFNCYYKKVTAESTEYSVRTQKAQYQIDLLMADSSRFIQHVFTKPSQMLPGSFNFVVNLVLQPMMI